MLVRCDELGSQRRKFLQLKQRLVAVPRAVEAKADRRLDGTGQIAVQSSVTACAIQLQNHVVRSLYLQTTRRRRRGQASRAGIARNQRAIESSGPVRSTLSGNCARTAPSRTRHAGNWKTSMRVPPPNFARALELVNRSDREPKPPGRADQANCVWW